MAVSLDDFYVRIKSIPPQYMFWYVIILLFGTLISHQIGITIFIMLILGVAIVIYFDGQRDYVERTDEEIRKQKVSLIIPESKYMHRYPNLLDTVYGLQDLSELNNDVFYDLIDNIDRFLLRYEDIKFRGVENISQNHENMMMTYKGALNNLHALTYGYAGNKTVDHRLHKGAYDLQTILLGFLEEVKEINNKDIRENGYDVNKKLINDGPDGYDKYEGDVTTFHYY